MFGVSNWIRDITRSFGMVRKIRFIYGKSIVGFRKSSGIFWYCIGGFLEGSGGPPVRATLKRKEKRGEENSDMYCSRQLLFMSVTVHDGTVSPPPSFLSYIKRGQGAGRSPPRPQKNPSRPSPSTLLLRRLGEALQDFSSTTFTTPSCCWDSTEIYYIRCPLERGEDRLHQQPYV